MQRALEMHREERFDYFFWLDSDVEFETADMVEMMRAVEQDLHCVTGVYFSRHGNNNPMLCFGDPYHGYNFVIDKPYKEMKESNQNRYFLVDGCGFGFYIMSPRAVMEYATRIEATKWFDSSGWFPTRDHPNDQRYVVGEDLYFCRVMKMLGYPTLCNSHVLLGHKGVTVDDWEENKGKEIHHCPVQEEHF